MNLQLNDPAAGVVQPPLTLDPRIDLTGGDKPDEGATVIDSSEAPSAVGEGADSDAPHPLHAAGELEASPHDGVDADAVVAVTDGTEQADPPDDGGKEPAATPIDDGDAEMPVTVAAEGDLHDLPGEQVAIGDGAQAVAVADDSDNASDEQAAASTGLGVVAEEASRPEPETDYGRPVHPVCALFPLMGEAELTKLMDDIKTNGQAHAVVIHEGQIVDGRNRILACRRAGLEPRVVEWRDTYHGEMLLGRWIWSVNAERRHLTRDQIIATHVLLREWELREGARQRQADHLGNEAGQPGALPTNSSEVISPAAAPQTPVANATKNHSGEVRHQLAQETGHSEYGVQQALNVSKADPELLRQVAKGKTTLRGAQKLVKAKAASAKPPASARGKGLPAKKGKAKGEKKPKAAFDMDAKVTAAMRSVDKVLAGLDEEHYNPFLNEMIKQLKSML